MHTLTPLLFVVEHQLTVLNFYLVKEQAQVVPVNFTVSYPILHTHTLLRVSKVVVVASQFAVHFNGSEEGRKPVLQVQVFVEVFKVVLWISQVGDTGEQIQVEPDNFTFAYPVLHTQTLVTVLRVVDATSQFAVHLY